MKQKKLFPNESSIDTSKSDLFGLSSSPKSLSVSSLGGNLHQLSNQQIYKLINLKFNNDPIALIKQLSYDLAVKESELILLRKEKFIREQELLKLCNEYGNLSSLEIDKKLNNLSIDNNVDNVLSELIDNAINDNLSDMSYSISSLASPKQRPIIHRNVTAPTNKVSSPDPSPPRINKSSNWLGVWFTSSEDLSTLKNSTPSLISETLTTKTTLQKRPHSRSFPLIPGIIRSSQKDAPSISSRVPVELESIDLNEPIPKTPHILSIDKYGFFNDADKFIENKRHEGVSEEVEEQGHQRKRGEDMELKQNNRIESLPSIKSSSFNSNSKNSITDLEVNGTTDIATNKPTIVKLKEISKLDDANNQQFENKWNSFFKELTKDYYELNNNLEPQTNDSLFTSNEIFGIQGLNLIKLDKSLQINNIEFKNYKTLHKLINQSGIPHKYRYNLWLELSGAKNLKINGEFQQLYEIATTTDDKLIISNINQINLDLHRTMPSNIYFNDLINSQPGPHFYKLKKILYSFVVYKPEIGYCQGMNKIIGNLLLGDNKLTEEDIFWIFIGLIDEILPHYEPNLDYFNNMSLKFIKINQKIMIDYYFPKFMPKLFQHLKNLNIQIEFITINWWLSLFTENFLNLEIWFKIFDNFLVSNIEIKLISLSLSIFKIFENFLLNLNNYDDVYLIMKNLNHNNATRMNLKYSELIQINNLFEKKIDKNELYNLRKLYT